MKELLFLLAATMFIISCGSDSEDDEPKTPSNEETIIGKWVKYEQASASAFTNFYDAFSKDTLTFRQDGTYTQVFEGSTSPINGTYSISNTRLLLGGLFVYDLIFENNNTMIMKEYGYGKDNNIYRFRRLK